MLKTSLTSIAAVLVLALAGPGIAEAAKPTPKHVHASHTTAAKRTASRVDRRVGTTGSGQAVGTNVARVTAAPTGDGRADQEECDYRAGIIDQANFLLGQAHQNHTPGSPDYSKIEAAQAELDRSINAAEDAGCFVVF
jgi:hypothetical protein